MPLIGIDLWRNWCNILFLSRYIPIGYYCMHKSVSKEPWTLCKNVQPLWKSNSIQNIHWEEMAGKSAHWHVSQWTPVKPSAHRQTYLLSAVTGKHRAPFRQGWLVHGSAHPSSQAIAAIKDTKRASDFGVQLTTPRSYAIQSLTRWTVQNNTGIMSKYFFYKCILKIGHAKSLQSLKEIYV